MKVTKRKFLGMAAATAVGITGMTTSAYAFNLRRPVDFVIMASPGGGADQMARFIQSVIARNDMTRRPLIPINRGGGAGAEALIWLTGASDPDHTILVTLNSFFTTPIRQPGLGIDVRTFTPIALMAADPFVLWVHRDSGITTFEQWLETVRAAGGEYTTGGTGTGQEDSIVFAFLNNAFDLTTRYIPFDGGGAAAAALAGQQVQATVNNPSEARGFFQSGDLVPLLVFSAEPMAMFPGVPTLREKGHDFAYFNQRAIIGPPGMSAEAAAFYHDLFTQVFNSAEWQEYIEIEGLTAMWLTPDEQRVHWQQQLDLHTQLLAELGG